MIRSSSFSGRPRLGNLLVNRTAMTHADHVYRLRPVVDISDDAVAAHAITPRTLVSSHGFAGQAGFWSYARIQELDQAATVLPV